MVYHLAAVAGRGASYRRFGRAVLVLSALVLSAPHSARAQSVDWERMDAEIETMLKDWTTPGVAVAVVQGDSVVFAKGYGVRRLGEPGRVGPETRFAVASNTKAFTAALLVQLQEQGQLSIDDPVIDHLPAFRMSDSWVTSNIQIADLLTHRSGLPTFGGDHLWIGQLLPRDEIVRRIRWLEPAGPFRASFHYQNLMYLVAGQVAAAAAGQNWDALMQERILGPLGMTGSSTTLTALEGIEDVASAHEKVDGELMPVAYDDVRGVAPAAALNSNVLDMARWMRANLNGGELDGTRIFSERAARAMQSVHYPLGVSPWAEANLGQRFNGYGFGWFIGEYRGTEGRDAQRWTDGNDFPADPASGGRDRSRRTDQLRSLRSDKGDHEHDPRRHARVSPAETGTPYIAGSWNRVSNARPGPKKSCRPAGSPTRLRPCRSNPTPVRTRTNFRDRPSSGWRMGTWCSTTMRDTWAIWSTGTTTCSGSTGATRSSTWSR